MFLHGGLSEKGVLVVVSGALSIPLLTFPFLASIFRRNSQKDGFILGNGTPR